MSIHSLVSLVYSQSYFNTANSIKDELNHYLGHRLASVWLDLYRMSNSAEIHINKAYSLFAKIWGCCRRTAIRAISKLERAGFIKKVRNTLYGCATANTYIVCLPDSLLDNIKSYPERRQVMPEIDYSVNQDLSTGGGSDTFVTDLVLVNKDIINTTEPKKIINACRQEDMHKKMPNRMHDNDNVHTKPQFLVHDNPKSIPKAMVNKIEKIVKAIPGISNPPGLVREAIHFVTTQRKFDNPWVAVGAFRKLLGKDGSGSWRTPFGMRYEKK